MVDSNNISDITNQAFLLNQGVTLYINSNYQIIGVNQAAEQGLQLQILKNEIESVNFLELIPESEIENTKTDIQEALMGKSFSTTKMLTRDKSKIFELTYSPLINSNFEINGTIIKIELQKHRADFHRLFGEVATNTTTPLLIAKPVSAKDIIVDFEITFSNNAFRKILGIEGYIAPSSTIFTLFPDLKSKLHPQINKKEFKHLSIKQQSTQTNKELDLEIWYSGKHLLIKAIVGNDEQELIDRIKYKQKLIEDILECSPSGILILKAIQSEDQTITDFECQFLNKEAARILGKPFSAIQNRPIISQLPSVHRQMVYDNLCLAVNTREKTEFEKICYTGWTNITVIPTNGGILVNLVDISSEKKTNEQLIYNQELLLQSQAAARVGTMEWNIQEGRIYWTPQCFNFWELSQETELNNGLILEKVHEEDRVKFRILIDRAIYDGENFEDEIRLVKNDQTIIYLKVGGELKYGAKGNAIRLICTIIDITDRVNAQRERRHSKQLKEAQKRLEESFDQLKQQSEEFKFLTDFMPQMVWSNLPNGQFDFFNNRWYEYTGISSEHSFEHGIRQVIFADDLEQFDSQWKSSVESVANIEVECRIYKYDGSYRWFLLRAMPLRNHDGNIIKWFGTCTDIHEQKLIREQFELTQIELKQKNQELSRRNTDLDNFVYTASHDLKAPINNIEGLVNGLIEECTEETQHMFLNLINQSVSRFKSTIEDLTHITSLTGKPDQSELVELSPIASEVLESNEDYIKQSGAIITMNFEVNTLSFSKKNIRSILFNLISNALKYSSPERIPTIKISSRSESGLVVLEVADNGLGMNQEDIPKMFGMFKRLHNHVEGTGIGMYIVKRVIENIGGSIEVESKINEGTTFKIYIPNNS